MSRKLVFFPVVAFILLILTSCWNYREVNEMAIVIGAALDKGVTRKYLLTVEILDVGGGQETQISNRVLSIEGETLLDAARRLISLEGKRGYWGHIQVLIVSEEIARDGISEVIKFFRQDAETRGDLYVVVSKGCSAREIFNADVALGKVMSETLAQGLESSKFLSEIPETRLYTLSQDLKSGKISPALPVVTLFTIDNKTMPVFSGAAVFRQGRMAGYLDGEETKAMLFVKDEIRGGVIVVKTGKASVSLEIIGSNTKIRTHAEGDRITFDINVETKVVIDEVIGNIEFSSLAVLDDFRKLSEGQLKNKIEDVIDRARVLQADIFGFGQKLYEDNPRIWNEISGDYETQLANIDVNLSVKIEIANTAIIFKQMSEGE